MDMVVNNKICKLVFLKEIQTLFHLNRKWYPKVFSDVHVKSISMAPAPRNFCFCAWMWTTSNIVLQVPFHSGFEGSQSQKPGTRNQEPKTKMVTAPRNFCFCAWMWTTSNIVLQVPFHSGFEGYQSQKPGTRNHKPGNENQELKTKNSCAPRSFCICAWMWTTVGANRGLIRGS